MSSCGSEAETTAHSHLHCPNNIASTSKPLKIYAI